MGRPSQEALGFSAAALQSGDVRAALDIRHREFGQAADEFDASIIATIEFILGRTPSVLADCPKPVLEPLRIVAAMMELWGTDNIREIVTIEGELDYRFSLDAIANMLHSHGCYLRSLESLQRAGIFHVKLLGGHDSRDCEACRAADGKSFPISEVPEIPLVACTCTDMYGCKVMVIADDRAA